MSDPRPAQLAREAMVAALSALSVSAASPDDTVSLSVNTDGVMTRLRLSDTASSLTPAQLADAVMRTYVEAQRTSAQRTAELLRPLGNAGYLTDRLHWRLQYEPGYQRIEEPPPPRRRGRDGEFLKNRFHDSPAPRANPDEPPSDDDFYAQGLRLESSW